MYNKLYYKFKSELTDVKIDRCLITIMVITFFIYCILTAIFWNLYKSWIMLLVSGLILIILCSLISYTFIFAILKKNSKLTIKDFFRRRKVSDVMATSQAKDIDIMLKVLNELNINTMSNVQEAIRHYQNVLLRKSSRGISVSNIISITISVIGIFFAGTAFVTSKDYYILFGILFLVMTTVGLICFMSKLIYKTCFYSLSEYALYERIEQALSEIYLSNELNGSTAKFGFASLI